MRKALVLCLLKAILIVVNPGYAYSQNSPKLYMAINDLDQKTWSWLQSNNVREVKVIYGKYIYPNDPLTVNENILKKEIRKQFKDSLEYGIGMLDWEGKGYNSLKFRANVSDYNKALDNFLKALRIAKKIRPNVKWGYFGLPFRRLETPTKLGNEAVWKKRSDNVIQILKESDVLFAAIYNSYPVSDPQKQLQYDKADLLNAISYAKRTNKDLYPVVWHRYEKRVNNLRHKVIPQGEFVNLFKTINSLSKTNNCLKGVVWWGGDSKFYDRNEGTFRQEANNRSTFVKNYYNLIERYTTDILGALK